MTLDYDIVIIGGSIAGRYAALGAAQLKAKVALVEPKANYDFIYHQTFREFATYTSDWQQTMLYAQGVAANQQQLHSPAILAAQGVDIILGNGKFEPQPHLVFTVNERVLKSRTYLLATDSVPLIPKIEGLQKTGFLTLSNIWQSLNTSTSAKNCVILGCVPQSIEIAQTLARLGYAVSLVVKHSHILPGIEKEIAQLLQAQLEVEGVRLLTETAVTQVRQIDNKKWVQAGDKAIETDEIIVTTQQPNIEFLNLTAAGVKWNYRRVLVNNKLQTTNSRIYACGGVIGGYDLINIANYEARTAVKNALFFDSIKVNYQHLPWCIFSNPTFAQVGLTEAQAKLQYSDNEIVVLRQYFKKLASAQIQDKTTGLCKIITLSNGEILGASIFGPESIELINLIGLAIVQKIKVDAITNLSPLVPSFSEILEQTALLWSQQQLKKNIALQEFLQSFFHFRRNWNL